MRLVPASRRAAARRCAIDAWPIGFGGAGTSSSRSGRALDSYARVSIVKQSRRVVAFEAQAWQDDPAKPIASAFGHFMLRKTSGGDED